MWLAESSANADSVTTILNLLPEGIKDLVLQHLNGRQSDFSPKESLVDAHTSRSFTFVSCQELHLACFDFSSSKSPLQYRQDSMFWLSICHHP